MKTVETVILQNLIYDEEYARKVIPFIKGEYFHSKIERLVFDMIKDFIIKFNNLPTKEALSIELDKNSTLNEEEYKNSSGLIDSFVSNDANIDWLIVETEKFCKDKAVYNAITE